MDKQKMSEIVKEYYNDVCEAYRLGNIESSYNMPIIKLVTRFGCAARDMSGERRGQTGENIDIKLWHNDEEVTETEPFAGVEAKKVGGIDARARSQIKTEADRFGNAILTDNLVWQFWRSGEDKMYCFSLSFVSSLSIEKRIMGLQVLYQREWEADFQARQN